MDNRFLQQSFESIAFLIQSTQKPKIKAGGSSSSTILNTFVDALCQDVLLLATRANRLSLRANRIAGAGTAQGAAWLSAFQSVSSRVDAASGYTQVLADIHSSFYVDNTTTATTNTVFGQATLPIRSNTDLLIQTDAYGNPDVFADVEISYAIGAEPNNLAYAVDSDALEMLKDIEQVWVLAETASAIWVKIKAPLQYRGLTPNVLEVWPIPAGGMDLKEVSYQRAGDTFTSTWVALDLTYLPGWNSSTSQVDQVGPFRLHLPNEPIAQLRIKFQPRSTTPWGLYRLKIYHTEYETSAALVVKDPYSRTVGNSTVRGKDPSALSLLSKTTATNKVTINLSTTDSASTPVITGVIMAVS